MAIWLSVGAVPITLVRAVSHHASTLFALSPSSSLRWRRKILSVQSVSWSKPRRKQLFVEAERRICQSPHGNHEGEFLMDHG